MTMKGIFVDDQDRSVAALITTRGTLEFEYMHVDRLTNLANAIISAAPLVVALDYRLDEDFEKIDPTDGYKGSALAQHLRDESISQPGSDFSIVLVSAEMNISNIYEPDRTAHDLFDRVYPKEQIEKKRPEVQRELISLGAAYSTLRLMAPNFEVAAILSLNEDEEDRVISQDLRFPIETAAAPHIVVRTVLKTIILQPGLLLDNADAAAILGVEQSSFEGLAPVLEKAGLKYEGLLSAGWQRWWSHRLEDWADQIFEARATSLSAAKRAELLNRRFRTTAVPAPSPWNEATDELVAVACGVCRRPVEMRHTVASFQPQLPRYAKRRKICWDCIQSDKHHYAKMHIDEADEDMIAIIKVADRTEN